MKNFNDLVPLNKIDLSLDDVERYQLDYFIYNKFFSNVISRYMYGSENANKYNILDIFCTRSYVKDCINNVSNVKYLGIDVISEASRNGEIIKPDIVCDLNSMPVKDKSYDFIFSRADKLGYGKNHKSLFEIERIIKPSGFLIIALSKFWYNIGFNQMLFCYRDWKYLEAAEIHYSFVDVDGDKTNHISTSKFFLIYKYYGN